MAHGIPNPAQSSDGALKPWPVPRRPRHANTPRQFECTRLITAEQVKQTIRRIPGFGVHDRKMSVVAQAAE
jgi:hypothetical protein